MRPNIACCGLDCEQCDAYIATLDDDQALREKTAKLWAELNHAPSCRNISTVRAAARTGSRPCSANRSAPFAAAPCKEAWPPAATARKWKAARPWAPSLQTTRRRGNPAGLGEKTGTALPPAPLRAGPNGSRSVPCFLWKYASPLKPARRFLQDLCAEDNFLPMRIHFRKPAA